MTSESDMEDAYRLRSTALRGLAAKLSGELRDTMLDAADHWDGLAAQAQALARSKKLIAEWENGRP